MLRRISLVAMAVASSYGLTALAGYILYSVSEGRSELHLSIIIRFVVTPLVAIVIGGSVGLLSKDHPIPTSIIGLAPWTITLLSPNKPVSPLSWVLWLVPLLVYLPLGGASSAFTWRLHQRPTN